MVVWNPFLFWEPRLSSPISSPYIPSFSLLSQEWALGKVEESVSVQGGKLTGASERLALLDKRAADSVAALEARLDALAGSLQGQVAAAAAAAAGAECKRLAELVEQGEKARGGMQSKMGEMDRTLVQLMQQVAMKAEGEAGDMPGVVAPMVAGTQADDAQYQAQQQKIAGLEEQVAQLTANSAAVTQQLQDKMDKMMEAMTARLQALEATGPTAEREASEEAQVAVAVVSVQPAGTEASHLEAAVVQLQAQVADLQARLLQQPSEVPAAAAVAAAEIVGDRDTAQLDGLVGRMEQGEARLQVQIDALAAKPAIAGEAALGPAEAEGAGAGLAAAVEELSQRLAVLEASSQQMPAASAALDAAVDPALPDEAVLGLTARLQSLESRVPAEEAQGQAVAVPAEWEGIQGQLQAVTERVQAMELNLAAMATSPPDAAAQSPPAPAEDAPPTGTPSELTAHVDALGDELHARVSELQQKMSHLLQLIVQRVKVLEVAVKGPPTDGDGRAPTPLELQGRADPPSAEEVVSLKQQMEGQQERLSAVEQQLAAVQAGGPAAAVASLPDMQRWEDEARELAARLQQLEGSINAGPLQAAPAPTETAAAAQQPGVHPELLEQRLAEVHEDGVARLQEMHDKITPVLQLLVQRVKALEAAGPGASAAASAGDSGECLKQVAEVQQEAAALSARISELDESLSNKLGSMQSKVSNVMQLLVQRVKALEGQGGGKTVSMAGSEISGEGQ